MSRDSSVGRAVDCSALSSYPSVTGSIPVREIFSKCSNEICLLPASPANGIVRDFSQLSTATHAYKISNGTLNQHSQDLPVLLIFARRFDKGCYHSTGDHCKQDRIACLVPIKQF